MIIRYTCSIFLLVIGVSSCDQSERAVVEINFENPYKFGSQIEIEVARDTTPWKYQMSAQSYADNGDYKNALRHWDLARGNSNKHLEQKGIDSLKALYRTQNAARYIIDLAGSHQVLIINEAHHSSRHRVFTKSLLKKLYNEGYKNIGFETLGNGEYRDSLLMERQYPIQESGYYTKDPQFGDLVRTALELGFHVFPYEQTNDSNGKPREIKQARNIQKEIEKRPTEKFIIHCGFDHAYEGIHEKWEKAMAARLTEYTGIDPLTIDQIKYSEKSKPEFSNSILKAIEINEPSVLIDANGKPMGTGHKERWTDLAVFHPRTEFINGRPNWLFNKENKSIALDLADVDISYPLMVLAYKKGEIIKTGVPLDIVEVGNRSEPATLALKGGDYEIVVINPDGDARKFMMNVQ